MISRDHIGVESEPRTITVEMGQLKFFAKATAQSDPIYSDEAAAKAKGHKTIPAPLTYAVVLMAGAPPKRGTLESMGVDMRRILHGEQSFTYHHPMYAGDVMTLVTKTSDIYAKKDGALEFIVQDTRLTNAAGQLCTEMRTVVVVRNG
jgi:acyl dehydratase